MARRSEQCLPALRALHPPPSPLATTIAHFLWDSEGTHIQLPFLMQFHYHYSVRDKEVKALSPRRWLVSHVCVFGVRFMNYSHAHNNSVLEAYPWRKVRRKTHVVCVSRKAFFGVLFYSL